MRTLINQSSGQRIVYATVLGCLIASPASAQRPAGPFAGLFGGDLTERRSEGLQFRGSLFGSYDENRADKLDPTTLLDPTTSSDQRFQRSGASAGVTGNLAYERNSERAQWSLAAGGVVREYWGVSKVTAVSYDVTSGAGVKLGPNATMNAAGSLTYSPYYRFAPFLGGGVDVTALAAGFGFASLFQRNVAVIGSVGVTTQLTKRSSLSANATWNEWRFLDGANGGISRWGGRVTFTQTLTKGLGFHVGYGREMNQFSVTARTRAVNESYDVGLDYGYGKMLEIARRTTVSFSTSTSAVRTQFNTRYRLNGSAVLTRGMGRTWSSSLRFSRATDFTAAFLEPILSDTARVSIGGQLVPRLQWLSGAGYSRGEFGFGGAPFKTYSGSSKLTYGMTRHVGLYGQYAYYWHKIPVGASLLPLPPTFSRNSVTAGLTLWVPIIDQMRGRT